jgi:hypothetical protein
MKLTFRNLWRCAVAILICAAGQVAGLAGYCAVSDGSVRPSEDGCKLAFVYNQENKNRLVVIDEKSKRRYEAPLGNPMMAPFWEGDTVYVIDGSGSVQGFSINAEKLTAQKAETISQEVVRTASYSRSQHRLYVIRTVWEERPKKFHHELSMVDFPTRKTLWTRRIEDAGLLTIMGQCVTVTGQKLVTVLNSSTGEKIATVEAPKASTSTDER